MSSRKHEGIEVRHSTKCATNDGKRCNCEPSYQAEAYDRRVSKKVRRTFSTLAAAKSWRADVQKAIKKGVRGGPTGITVEDASREWIELATSGAVKNRSGQTYKPSALRGYIGALEQRIIPALGRWKLEALTRLAVQEYVDGLEAEGIGATGIRRILMPLRVVYRRAIKRGLVGINPVSGVELPAVVHTRDRVASPNEALQLLSALQPTDAAIWAIAMFGGLRLGEIQALRRGAIDVEHRIIHVEASYDAPSKTFVTPKTRKGVRRVPITPTLWNYISACVDDAAAPDTLLFTNRRGDPFTSTAVRSRARRTWREAGLDPIGFHECRHTCASMMIAAGVNAKTLASIMGHASITITFDLYGHLMPGAEAEVAGLFERYLRKSFGR